VNNVRPVCADARTILPISVCLLTLSACGGGSSSTTTSSSSSSSSGGTPPTYNLSGSVSGYSSSGLVLAVNGTAVPVTSNATSVTLASGLASGASFQVSVQTQPTGESCSVASGTGMIASADYANVVITCAAQAYSLGGVVSGLTAAGLVLANGTDTLSVPSGATGFTMPTQVAYGSSYDVVVQTQPAGESCAVATNNATMPAGAVTSVAVTCTAEPFTVGGPITGLGNNSGLVLANGSDTLPVAAAATAFQMDQPVTFGSPYNVTVQSSPAGLTCSVANGSSSAIGAANVNNVSITCSALAYSLGGGITGLTAAGLKLTDTTDTITVTSGSPSYTLPTAVAFGSIYTVSVAQQPTGEHCSVSNASNTMPAGVVNNANVTCSLNSYNVTGSITGLTSTGLVLLDNGTDATTIAANAATFTMQTQVASQSPYAVTVQSHPPGVNCVVTGGSGTVGGGDTTGISIACSAGAESVAYSFAGGTGDGQNPQSGVVLASNSKLYGVTQTAGVNGDGVLYQFDPAASSSPESVLYSFYTGPGDAGQPVAALIQGTGGMLYGTSIYGGANTFGSIYQTDTTGTEAALYSFVGSPTDGLNPTAGVIQAGDGNLYGVAPAGGTNNTGILFEYNLSASSNNYSILYAFGPNTGTDAQAPSGSPFQASDGNLYGLASSGGANGFGALYEYSLSSGSPAESVLYSFAGPTSDGSDPVGGLVQVGTKLYGVTNLGGANSCGTIFSYDLQTTTYTTVYSFANTTSDGCNPQGTLLLASDGNLYGLTTNGGANGNGVIFELIPSSSPTESLVYSFAGGTTDGANPAGSLAQTANGDFYGTTNGGGANGLGTIFVLN
jgi:uncharacterized repeat protein (TIGR03803 family)